MKRERKYYGAPLRAYDNGGETADRYTLLPPRSQATMREFSRTRNGARLWTALAADAQPFHPQGFGQHTEAMAGPHLGRRITWAELPADVQKFARQSFLREYCP